MKILYIPSGFPRIYHYIDRSIIKTLTEAGHIVKSYSHFKGLAPLKFLVNRFKPDLMLTTVGFLMPVEITDWLRTKGIKTVAWFTEDPYYMDTTSTLASSYDYIFTIEKAAIEVYRNGGHHRVYLLSLAADTEVFHMDERAEPIYDLCLIGYPYENRKKLVHYLLEHTNYTLLLGGDEWYEEITAWKDDPRITWKSWISPEDTVRYFHQSRIVLNPQRPHNLEMNENSKNIPALSVNNRTFDIASCGSFQLISWKENLPAHMKEDTHLVMYRDEQDCLDKIKYYMEHPHERKIICATAKETVMHYHTYAHRMHTMMETIQNSHHFYGFKTLI